MEFKLFIETTLERASAIALSYFGKVSPTTKPTDNNQVLTEADLAIGEFIVNKIKKAFPDHNIIDEESGVIDNGSVFTWVIDPIEATSNFASGSNQYGIMIGLLQDGTPIAGGIILPATSDLYIATKGTGATHNGAKISVTKETELSKMLVSVGVDSHNDEPEKTKSEMLVVADIVLAVRNIRNSGCEAIDPMLVAEGVYGGRVNLTARIWDNVAPQIICEEAGAVWTDLKGKAIDYSQPSTLVDKNMGFCVAPPRLHLQLITIIGNRL